MNISEALKSGKRFRRSGSSWVEPEEAQDLLRNIDYSALIADDWEVEEAEVTITSSQYDAAYQLALEDYNSGQGQFTNCLKRRLGL